MTGAPRSFFRSFSTWEVFPVSSLFACGGGGDGPGAPALGTRLGGAEVGADSSVLQPATSTSEANRLLTLIVIGVLLGLGSVLTVRSSPEGDQSTPNPEHGTPTAAHDRPTPSASATRLM